MSQTFSCPGQTMDRHSMVYALEIEHDEWEVKVHVAVHRDDLHAFVVFGSIPGGISGLATFPGLLAALLHKALQTSMADWQAEHIVFGETSWLTRRDCREWRAIRRIEVSVDGTVTTAGWLPPGVGEPILRMLENSVPSPDLLSDEVDEF